jgi:UDP-GlcNAc:undecaprenyl-phosphate GlcNAc-1-phosphate transferase
MLIVLSFVASLLLVVLAVPPIINYALKKQLFEARGERIKNHCGQVPHFGGVAIFLAVLLPTLVTSIAIVEINWMVFASLFVFGVGLVDDLKTVSPASKFLFQFAAAFLVVIKGQVYIMPIEMLFNQSALTHLSGIILSLVFIVSVVNAFNLIDGIDGLAGSVGLLICAVYAYVFHHAGLASMSCLSCSAAGALMGFLFFNLFSKRKIFMGDCGSLFVGLLVAFLSMKLLSIEEDQFALTALKLPSKVGFVAALLCIPLFDTLRVFLLRIAKKSSPFKADDNHIHHRLLSIGLSHLQATAVLLTLNLGIIAFSLYRQALGNTTIIMIVLVLMIFLNSMLTLWINKLKGRTGAFL